MKSEKMIRSMLEQYEFNLEMDKEYRSEDTECIERTKQWVNCLRWVLDIEPIK